jgi:hypothetical protein
MVLLLSALGEALLLIIVEEISNLTILFYFISLSHGGRCCVVGSKCC